MTLAYGKLSYTVSHSIRLTENTVVSGAGTATIDLITQSNIILDGQLFNHATTTGGDIRLIAGWDGITAYNESLYDSYSSMASLTATTPFGNNSGSIQLGDGNQTNPITIGSRYGKVNLYGHDIALTAGSGSNGRFVQIGYSISDQGNSYLIPGLISLRAKNNLRLDSGTTAAFNFTQIGHVGADQINDTTIEAQINAPISFAAGNDIAVNGGNVQSNYSQIGHGGFQARGDFNGLLQLLSLNTPLLLNDNNGEGYSRLGHDE